MEGKVVMGCRRLGRGAVRRMEGRSLPAGDIRHDRSKEPSGNAEPGWRDVWFTCKHGDLTPSWS